RPDWAWIHRRWIFFVFRALRSLEGMETTTSHPSPSSSGGRRWSRLGFVLAASGSAIGLGNVVFFPANAYRYGGGGFYLPYLVALLTVGIPLLALELGLGHQLRRAYPAALREVAGRRGEALGWWALANTTVITLYYVAILGWVVGMFFGSLGPLWRSQTALSGFAVAELANPHGYFFHMLSGWSPVLFILGVWLMNGMVVRDGAASIERAVKVFVPSMWVLMLVLVIRGLTLPGGEHGVWHLFAPDLSAMTDIAVWQGAFSQIFFTLSIGFGVMTTYASYLPKKSDTPNGALLVSFLNCGFEYVAGVAIFAVLFAFAAVPQASSISMTFFIVPHGIGELPGGGAVVEGFGLLFFLLLLLAGLSSSASMLESVVGALIDKFHWQRRNVVAGVCLLGAAGSSIFALPQVVDPALRNNGTLGLTLLDLVDHWAFGYGLLIVGLGQCLILGRLRRIERLRRGMAEGSSWPVGPWFDRLIGLVIPVVLGTILAWSLVQEVRGGLYGSDYGPNFAAGWGWLASAPLAALFGWLLLPTTAAVILTLARPKTPGSPE
ncbi:MAG: sodium-dependent transporter, partial [Holophagales bacterium]|nr:sodium-dependent transporter [Holophagales bacterium]